MIPICPERDFCDSIRLKPIQEEELFWDDEFNG